MSKTQLLSAILEQQREQTELLSAVLKILARNSERWNREVEGSLAQVLIRISKTMPRDNV